MYLCMYVCMCIYIYIYIHIKGPAPVLPRPGLGAAVPRLRGLPGAPNQHK